MLVRELFQVLDLQNYNVLKIDSNPESMSVIRALYYNRQVKQAIVKAHSKDIVVPDIQVSYLTDAINLDLPAIELALPNDARYTHIELNVILEEVKP